MIVKGVIDEDFINYKKPAMIIECAFCDMKCGKENCQNADLLNSSNIVVDNGVLVDRYLKNKITSAIVFQGLEPFHKMCCNDVLDVIRRIRNKKCPDDIVIYTGYDKDEIPDVVNYIKKYFFNIVVKFGRYMPDRESVYDPVLETMLASSNQYAERIC